MFAPQSVSFLALPVPSSFSVPFRSFSTDSFYSPFQSGISSCLVTGCLSQLLFQSSETFIDGDETSCSAPELSRTPKPTFKQSVLSTKHRGSWHHDSHEPWAAKLPSLSSSATSKNAILGEINCKVSNWNWNTAMYLHPKCCWCSANTSLEIDISLICMSAREGQPLAKDPANSPKFRKKSYIVFITVAYCPLQHPISSSLWIPP